MVQMEVVSPFFILYFSLRAFSFAFNAFPLVKKIDANLEKDLHIQAQLILNKSSQQFIGQLLVFSLNGVGTVKYSYPKTLKLDRTLAF